MVVGWVRSFDSTLICSVLKSIQHTGSNEVSTILVSLDDSNVLVVLVRFLKMFILDTSSCLHIKQVPKESASAMFAHLPQKILIVKKHTYLVKINKPVLLLKRQSRRNANQHLLFVLLLTSNYDKNEKELCALLMLH